MTRFRKNDVFRYAFLTACYTGLRTGEIFALTWNDIDFENRTINIKHNVYSKTKNEKGKWYIGSTKTEKGERQVYICDTLLKLLKKFKNKQEMDRNKYKKEYYSYCLDEVKNKYGKVVEYKIIENRGIKRTSNRINLVFVNKKGRYSGTETIRYPFKVIHNEMGIKDCRFYDLRGTYATKLLRNGLEIRDVADILGHVKIETTENYYIMSTKDNRNDIAIISENLFQLDIENF